MIEWFASHPWIAGVVTFFLAWSDWLLTVLQERERHLHYGEHYHSYPVDTIEGNAIYVSTINKLYVSTGKARRIAEPRHLIPALIVSVIVALTLLWIPQDFRALLIGYVWGLYLIVDTTHFGNLLGYRAARRGLHGKLYLHQRTGYLIQLGRYVALAIFLILLAACSASIFVAGVAIAGVSSAARQLVWMRKIPVIAEPDEPPSTASL